MGRRGPRAKAGIREPNGRMSRKPVDVTTQLNGDLDAEQREALRVGVESRRRLFKINPAQLRDTDAGTFVGRLRLKGDITLQQSEAAARFAEIFHDMQATLGGPKPSGAVNLNATHGMPEAENVARSIKARADWEASLKVIQERQNQLRGGTALYAALDYCVIMDADCPHMLEWLREGLDTLARHFKIGDKRDARVAA